MNVGFRIWDKKYKCFSEYGEGRVDGSTVYFENLLLHRKGLLCLIGENGVRPANECDFIIHKHTGSPDKNNNPIYESDIVLWDQQDPFDCTPSKAKKVVGWNQRCMQFRLYNHPTEIGQSGGEEFLAEDVVVIGNIFDWKNEECRYLLDESVKDKL